ncbi:MAG: folate-binding protein YgfZ [Undibacterium sp.]|nr:folate-binding protein YgfZ [Opitutaceae bacterium]
MTISSTLQFSGWGIGALLRVTGEDAATFLQGQFTNELRNLKTGGAVYGLWLNQKGKVVADSFVIAGAAGGGFFIVSYFCEAAGLQQRLEDYIIADDVAVEDLTKDWTGVSLVGEGAAAWSAGQVNQPGMRFAGRRTKGENVEWIFPRAELAAVRAQLVGFTEIGCEELARVRIEAGIPAVPADIGAGDLPGEGGLEGETISYTKGCYLGQEVMARLKSMGQVRRRLKRVGGRGEAPQAPAALWQGGRQVGELRSAAKKENGFVGLAMLSLVNFQPEQALALTTGGAAEIRLAAETSP